MNKDKETYLRALILFDDISCYHNELNSEQDWNKKLRLFKNCFVALDIFRDSFPNFNFLYKNDESLITLGRDLKKRLQFINHLRNKLSGHLNSKLIEKAVEWEPHIFYYPFKSNKEGQLLLVYKTLLESGINSYIDEESKQKIFSTEIDLFYPPDQTLFFDFIGNLNQDCIKFLISITNILKEKIEFWDVDKIHEMASIAAKTNFNLKNKK